MNSNRKSWPLVVIVAIIALLGVLVAKVGSSRGGLLFALAIAPSAFLLWHFYNADKYKRESKRLLGGTFLLGALATIPAIIIETIIGVPPTGAGVLVVFAYFLFGVGLVEELMKFLSIRIYAYRAREFDEPMDGIVFGVAAALGFATIENLLAVYRYGVAAAIIRAIVSVPGHAFWGAIVGFYLGEAKTRKRWLLALQGLAIAVFLHGLFDTLEETISNPIIGFILLLALVWIVYFKVVKKEIAQAELESRYREPPISTGSTDTGRLKGSTQIVVKFCGHCGTPAQAGAKFCYNCGQRLAATNSGS